MCVLWVLQVYLLYNFRSNDFARSAPCGEAVEDHEAFLAEGIIEVFLRLEVVYALLAHCCVEALLAD